MHDWDIIIVGAGPAGCAAALELNRINPSLAHRTLVLDRAVFPRPKLCGGGVTSHADALLSELGVQIDVPSFLINAVRLTYKDSQFTLHFRNLFRVVRREEFDAALVRCVKERGIEVHEGDALIDFQCDPNQVNVRAAQGQYTTQVLIGADGANSMVRQKLCLVHSDHIARLIEVVTPVQIAESLEFREHTAIFDFTPIASGIQGYYWDFPVFNNGEPNMNRGVFDSRVNVTLNHSSLVPVLSQALESRRVEFFQKTLRGHPERWYDAGIKHSAERVLLAGDAAGTEPLLGEGISHALDFGRMSARAAATAIRDEDFSFANYERNVARSALGRRLRIKRLLARFVYGKRSETFYRLGFGLARMIFGK